MSEPGDISRRGIMLVLSSPSGAGKTTLTRHLLEHENRRGSRQAGAVDLGYDAAAPRRAKPRACIIIS